MYSTWSKLSHTDRNKTAREASLTQEVGGSATLANRASLIKITTPVTLTRLAVLSCRKAMN